MQIEDWLAARAKPRSLERGRHEACPPHPAATRRLLFVIQEDDEAGQVLILASQPVVDPGPQARASPQEAARIHHRDAAHVVEAGAHAGMDHANVVDIRADVPIPIGDGQAALSIALPGSRQRQDRVFAHRHGGKDALDRAGQGLAGEPRHHRLVIERVDVARAPVHEQENRALGPAEKLTRLRDKRIDGRSRSPGDRALRRQKSALGHQAVKRQSSEAAAGAAEKIAAAGRAFKMLHGTHFHGS